MFVTQKSALLGFSATLSPHQKLTKTASWSRPVVRIKAFNAQSFLFR